MWIFDKVVKISSFSSEFLRRCVLLHIEMAAIESVSGNAE